MQKHPMDAKLSEKNDRLRVIYSNVNSLTEAFNYLEKVLKVE